VSVRKEKDVAAARSRKLPSRRPPSLRGLHLPAAGSLVDLASWTRDPELIASLRACIEARRALLPDLTSRFVPHSDARAEVAPERLAALLARGEDVHGLASDRSLSNVIAFNLDHVQDAVQSAELLAGRRRLDAQIERKANETFAAGHGVKLHCSGDFWYPPGGYMTWHTNNAAPGWRIYLTHAEEPGRSFFRYRDPVSGEIVTVSDHEWDARAFRIDPDLPFWHAIYSDTNRFSFGYIVYPHRPLHAFVSRIKRLLGRRLG
jgi:hypothetical protein